MGASKGLNILPHKSWHVYNRENREKVARDEREHAEKQNELQEKQQQAEREHRHRLLLQRARQRHGGAAVLRLEDDHVVGSRVLHAGNEEEREPEPQQAEQLQPRDVARGIEARQCIPSFTDVAEKGSDAGDGSRDTLAFASTAGAAAGAEVRTVTDNDDVGDLVHGVHQDASRKQGDQSPHMLSRERPLRGEGAATRLAEEATMDGMQLPRVAAAGISIASAGLLRTLPSQAAVPPMRSPTLQQPAKAILHEHVDPAHRAARVLDHQPQPQQQHINLFADEEARARNPERREEDRRREKTRGDARTRTSDARFDEGFKFAHGLTGTVPWYAQKQQPIPVPPSVQSRQSLEGKTRFDGCMRMEHQMRGVDGAVSGNARQREALHKNIGPASNDTMEEWRERGRAALEASARAASSDAAVRVECGLLSGVKVLPPPPASTQPSGSSQTFPMGLLEGGDKGKNRGRKRSKHKRNDDEDVADDKDKERKRKEDAWAALREERLRREAEERKRQRAAARDAFKR